MKYLLRWLLIGLLTVIGCVLIIVVVIILLLWHFNKQPVINFLSWCHDKMDDLIDYAKCIDHKMAKDNHAKKAKDYNDWKGWTPGDVKYWTVNDGDDRVGEATNILSYIAAHGIDNITDSDAFGVERVTINEIAEKLRMAGYGNQADVLQTQYALRSINSIFTKPKNESDAREN